MKPHDLILMGNIIWVVQGVYLGGLNSEGVYHVKRVGASLATVSGVGEVESYVPTAILDAAINSGAVLLYERTKGSVDSMVPEFFKHQV